ncbi:uncharacterized protein LOC129911630 [Episyrphus balteatus]|uniref:uncharacterized protein LOC129911630 n=1 Tax=Episyrphus balteatus TaxID=286459 RepID=UPI00248527CF|nr:uncharacterized protein LOC129911630 [Episyrphus balteatus]
MALKINLICAALMLTITYSHFVKETSAFCSLEKMKTFAVEACEHLFANDEPLTIRHKREFHHRSKSNELENGYHHKKHHTYAVRRSSYPRGGYLKVAQSHFEHLSRLSIFPMYKSHVNKKHFDEDRHKRDASALVGLPYCCYNKCDEDFFCR